MVLGSFLKVVIGVFSDNLVKVLSNACGVVNGSLLVFKKICLIFKALFLYQIINHKNRNLNTNATKQGILVLIKANSKLI